MGKPSLQEIRPAPFPTLTANDTSAYAAALCSHVDTEYGKALDWYETKRKRKRWLSRALRTFSILATAFAGLVPVFGEIFQSSGVPKVNPLWGSVALGLAGALLLIERFFGCTTGWVRYMKCGLEIGQLFTQFQIDRTIRQLQWDTPPTKAQIIEFATLVQSYLERRDRCVMEETTAWISEFQASVRSLDDAAKAVSEIKKLGAIQLTVTNGAQCKDGWQVSVDKGPEESGNGSSKALIGIQPGIHTITVKGNINGKDVSGEIPATVQSTEIVPIKIELT